MLFKRGSTISAAEGGCQAEVGGVFLRSSLSRFRVNEKSCSRLFYGQRWLCGLHGRSD
jgi:hypothetical protein